MLSISLRINEEEKLFKEYAKSQNMNVSTLVRSSILKRIEDDIDIKLYKQALKKTINNQQIFP